MKYKIQTSSFAIAAALLISGISSISVAQTVQDNDTVEAGLQLPNGQKFFGTVDPNTRRATAIVNGEILTGTDVEHRLALLLAIRNVEPSEAEKQQFRTQILADLIDETLQIQEARANEIEVDNADIASRAERRFVELFRRPFSESKAYLEEIGSSQSSFLRLVHGQVAWSRLLSRNVRVNVSEQEVNAILEKLKADKGKTEYRVGEIYLSYTPETQEAVLENSKRILDRLQQGASFEAFARQFSEATTSSVGGDLGFVRPEVLPAAMAQALPTMQTGQIATIPVPGGLSIMLLIDKKQILTTDIRDSVLSLKQISLALQEGGDQQATFANFSQTTQSINGCGQVEEVASKLGGEVGSNENLIARQLPPQLQEIMLNMQVGQVSPTFNDGRGLTVFILCGRDQPKEAKLPTFDEILVPLENERVDRRANIYLRDLRRDAIIEYN